MTILLPQEYWRATRPEKSAWIMDLNGIDAIYYLSAHRTTLSGVIRPTTHATFGLFCNSGGIAYGKLSQIDSVVNLFAILSDSTSKILLLTEEK